MVGNTRSLVGTWLRGPDLELAIHGDRIAIHDFAMETLCKGDRERSLPAGGRT
jgi:hypothetical protein